MSQNSGQASTAGRVTFSSPTDTERSSLHNSRSSATDQHWYWNVWWLVHGGGAIADVGGGVGNGVGGSVGDFVGKPVGGGVGD